MHILVVAALLVALAAVVFALQNPTLVVVKFAIWQFQGSLALVLLLTFALGFFVSLLLSLAGSFRRKKEQIPS